MAEPRIAAPFQMLARLGLQSRMTLSYVVVTAAAVVLVEALALAFVLPGFFAGVDLQQRVQVTALDLSAQAYRANQAADGASLQLPGGFSVGSPSARVSSGQVQLQGSGVAVPILRGSPNDLARRSFAVVLDRNGGVLASSLPDELVSGTPLAKVADKTLPPPSAKALKASAEAAGTAGGVVWATAPILPTKQDTQKGLASGSGADGKPPGPPPSLGTVYVQVPNAAPPVLNFDAARPLLQAGLILLGVSLPVGVLFGLLTTRGVVGRLGRLAATSARFAEGDLSARVVTGRPDEVGRLERQFNDMAERLAEARAVERLRLEEGARAAERTRIARELHDAISQDLFSLGLVAGGLERALPEDSPLREKAAEMRGTVAGTIQEMNALLLELRPSLLEQRGLVPALAELCEAYRTRLGVSLVADLEAVPLAAAAEHAVFRAAQEGLANAVRHAAAHSIRLSLQQRDGHAELLIADDGRGFEAAQLGGGPGLGLRLMRDRISELGGALAVNTTPGGGTQLTVSLPVAA